ncbi:MULTISPECIES: IS110 family transposase [unclassified Micromonospora]|uniref:IS110 family transposase n=1 Tax=unclassified Micromonospora TaxID=2617518 RepID=UPI00098D1CF1|nr:MULTISPECIES: IS110 family transposase [unclassified Micromonospora]MDI5937147.1 IS110 family transposase [Micromonospora sp. DH15]OON27066.1 IS110 family transposase [Micromonospora sp. Rc5]
MAIVADQYDFVIGVDTHAASHTLALITAGTGAVGQQAQFPTSPSGLRRAVDWIERHTHQSPTLIVIDGAGSYGATFTEQLSAAGLTVAEAPDVAATTRRRRGKSDAVDAVAMAQAARSLDINELCWPRAGGDRTALRVLTVAREQMSGERTRAVNALTALLRTVDLGIDARRALTTTTIATVAAWRTRSDNATLAVCRVEAIRLARRIRALDAELAANHTALHEAVTAQAPQLLALPGVGAVVAATVLLAWSHPGRVRSEAAFAALAGASPLPASSGNTTRYRLNRGGDRRLNRALYTVALVRMGHDPRTRDYVNRRTREGRTKREIMRSLKRYISRQLFRTLNGAHPATSTT